MEEESVHCPLIVSQSGNKVLTLQDLSRRCIVRSLTLRCIQQVAQLPLPNVVKNFVETFRVPEDFDTRGAYIDYNFSFPSHLHHRSHQVHPAVCSINGSKVLMACVAPAEKCVTCEVTNAVTLGRVVLEEHKKDLVGIWRSLHHTNLMNCLLSLVDCETKMECYVLEFPEMNLRDFVQRVSMAGKRVPEYLVWETLSKLTSVLLYLAEKGVAAWDLCQPEHVVLDVEGEVKLENLLLYRPSLVVGACSSHPARHWPVCYAPELQWGEVSSTSVVWGLGYILHEMVKPIPLVPIKDEAGANFSYLSEYFQLGTCTVGRVMSWCFRPHPRDRPTLEELSRIATQEMKKMANKYRGPRSLLEMAAQC